MLFRDKYPQLTLFEFSENRFTKKSTRNFITKSLFCETKKTRLGLWGLINKILLLNLMIITLHNLVNAYIVHHRYPD